MNLLERVLNGRLLIEAGKTLGRDTALLEEKVKELQGRLNEEVRLLRLSEFEQRNIAVEIYSDVLGCNLWICSNDEMVTQIKQDAPDQVCYTVAELRHLLSLNPSPESLKTIHDVKTVFPSSSIAESIPSKKS